MSSINPFHTGKSGLFTSRAALATTGHNIANVNTEGFSRQRVEQSVMPPAQMGNTTYGTGVKVQNILRINDDYLTRQISNESKYLGDYEEKEMALSQAEEIFNEIDNAGLNRLMSKFFNEFRKLGNEPESEAMRATVRESAESLIADFHRIARNLDDVRNNIDNRLDANLRAVNELTTRIAHLNEEIKRSELQGGNANDLRDSRDLATQKLSSLINANVATNERGELTISVSGVGPLVSGVLKNKLYAEKLPDGTTRVMLENLAPADVTDRLHLGKIGGLLEVRKGIIQETKDRLDQLAYHFTSQVNAIHRQGYNMSGETGINFFENIDSITDATHKMSLSRDVAQDVRKIATALTPNAPGDNRVVQMIAQLQHQSTMSQGTATFDDFFNATVGIIATTSQKNKQMLEHQGHVLTHLNKVRESISGVSLDEETTNLVQFQHAFDASAKVIKVADEMLETVLNLRR